MEESVIGEDKCDRSELTPASKPTRSLIDLRSMELANATKKPQVGKCGHFSIRGYVAEVRKKDIKICWPFPAVDRHKDLEEQADLLPPLRVADFRWWSCHNCLKKNDATGDATETDIDTFEGQDGGAEEAVNQAICGTICAATNSKPCLTGERVTDEASKMKINLNTDKHGCNLSACETAIASKSVCHDKHKTDDLNVVSTGHTSKLHSVELDENVAEFFGNDENIVRNNIQDEQCAIVNGNSCGTLRRRKIRKVRLLSDIIRSSPLGKSGLDGKTDHIKPEAAHSKAAQDVSSGIGILHGPKRQVTVQGNDKQVILGRKKKRKMPQDEDEWPLQMSCPKGMPETVGILKGNAETRDIETTVVHSESAADASVKIGLRPDLRNFLTKRQNDKQITLAKKKNVMPQFEVEESSLMPGQEGISSDAQIARRDVEIKCSGAEIVPYKAAQDVFTGNGLDPDPKSYLAAESNNGGNFLLGKNKRVNSEVEGQSSLMSSQEGMTGKDQIMRTDVGLLYKGADTIPLRSSQDEFNGGGVHHGLSHAAANRKAIKSKKQNSIPPFEGGVYMPHVENGGSSLFCQPEASSGRHNNESHNVQGNPVVLKNQCDQRDKKRAEQAALDDIPMDIVELMAKNQHERRLFNAGITTENSCSLSGSTEKVKGANPMNFTDVLGSEMLRFLREKNSCMQKTQSSNERTGMHITGKRVASTEWKPNGYPPPVNRKNNRINFGINQQEQTHASMGSALFSPSWEKQPSSGAQFPDIGSSRNCGKQSFNWNGDVVGHRSSQTCLQSSKSYHTTQKVSRQSSWQEDHRVWSPVTPNHKPFGFNNPQKSADDNSDTVPQCLELFPLGNFHGDHSLKSMNPNDIQLEKQKRKFDSEPNKRVQPEYPFAWKERGNYQSEMMGPLDSYTHETIPALHLLRLMDAGVSSGTPANANKNHKFTKRPHFPHDNHDKSGLEVRQSKNSELSMHRTSFNCFTENQRLGKFGEHFPSVPKVNIVGSSFQRDDNFTRATGFGGSFSTKLLSNSFKSQVKERTQSNKPPTELKGLRSDRSVSRDGSAGKYHQFHGLEKGLLSASDSMPFSVHSREMGDSSKRIELEVNKKGGTVWPGTSSCGTEICVVNRNPADFSIPEAGNVYMIGSADLKRKKTVSSRDKRPSLTDRDGHKPQKMMKLAAIQEHAHHQ